MVKDSLGYNLTSDETFNYSFKSLAICRASTGQDHRIDSLKVRLQQAKTDTDRVLIMAALVDTYSSFKQDSAFSYSRRAFTLSQSINYIHGQYLSYQSLFNVYNNVGDYPSVLESQVNALKYAEMLPNRKLESMARTYITLGYIYRIIGDYQEALKHHYKAIECQRASGKPLSLIAGTFCNASLTFLGLKMPDSALASLEKGLSVYNKSNPSYSLPFTFRGNIEEELGNFVAAEEAYRKAIRIYWSIPGSDNQYYLMRPYLSLAQLFQKMQKMDSCVYYNGKAFQTCKQYNYMHYEMQAAKILWQVYESKEKPDSVVKYLKAMILANDSVFSQGKVLHLQSITYSEDQRQKDIDAAREKYAAQVRLYTLLAALGVFLLIAFILYRNNRQKQKANTLLQEQKKEIEMALSSLKTTQVRWYSRKKWPLWENSLQGLRMRFRTR